jgi:2-polyprenyl-3-methyl-5-hydroxy-6-metoxy-1,4-benzoquinol methylase
VTQIFWLGMGLILDGLRMSMTKSNPKKLTCDVCGSRMVDDAIKDTFRCPGCGFFSSTLPITINDGIGIDEARREVALKSLRFANYDQLLGECADLLRAGSALLDVGCAHGWFLEAALSRGIHACGIEPDRRMADLARAAGHVVAGGFFPGALAEGDRYDAITFNDVLEHIPDLPAFLADLGRNLKPWPRDSQRTGVRRHDLSA